jgi:ferredoxin-type protein NapH
VIIAAIAYLGLYAHYRAANAIEDVQLMAGAKGAILSCIDRVVSTMPNPQAFLEGFKGTLWSMKILGIDISDPLAFAEVVAAAKAIHLPFVMSIIIPVLVTLIFGRVFCSWICPASLLFAFVNKLRAVLKFAEINPASIRFSLNNKYIVLAVGLMAAAVVSQPLFAIIYPPAVLSRLMHAWIFGTTLTGMLLLMFILIAIELFVSPHWWCRSMCPGGALYAMIGWPRILRVKLKQELCTKCGSCEAFCQPGINPAIESSGIECTNCGECIKNCPEEALYFTAGRPSCRCISGIPKYKLSNLIVFICISFTILTGFPSSAGGHHILGLPHYSYKENYPQAPTLEYPAQAGPYDILLTSYPGKPVPEETASFSIYIKNRDTREPYNHPITIQVLQTFTFGRSAEILKPTICQPFEQPHKLAVTFPEDGEYVVELTFDIEGKPEIIPFILTVGEPSATTSVLVTIGILLLLFIIVVRAIKIKRARRELSA